MDIKRVLAYSTISQLGYMVYAIGAGGIFASQFHPHEPLCIQGIALPRRRSGRHALGTRDMRKMGGLGREMPFVRAVFLIGALSLAGLPVLNGFWSKEMVLEEGLRGGPLWAYIAMLACAGLTALYTFRMVWLVFYGERRSEGPVHDAPSAMRLALGVLALGALVSWVSAGPFGKMLQGSPPFHTLDVATTGQMMVAVLTAWPTWLALAVVGLGLAAWWWRERLASVVSSLRFVAQRHRLISALPGSTGPSPARQEVLLRSSRSPRPDSSAGMSWASSPALWPCSFSDLEGLKCRYLL